jgi:hypothetical protein
MNENNKTDITTNNGLKQLSIFKDDSFNYLYGKSEKITTALYMITNFMSVNEPLKWQIRENSLRFLDSIMSLNKVSLSGRSLVMTEVGGYLFQIKALFSIAYKSGFISDMNYEVVQRELDGLVNFLAEYDSNKLSVESPLFNKTFFTESEPKGQIVEKSFGIKNDSKKVINYKGQTTKDNKRTSNVMSDRKTKILAVIKDKKEVTIKDISVLVSGCSEKTLQRELLSMVSDGLIKKEGERRWSKYSIK